MIADCDRCGLVEPRISPVRETAFCPVCGKWLTLEDPYVAVLDEAEND